MPDAALAGDWAVAALPAGAAADPRALEAVAPAWRTVAGPGTAAAALRAAGAWSLDGPARDFDAEDWWWRCRFPAPGAPGRHVLHLDGLATVAEVWLNGEPLLASSSMWLAHERDVTTRLRAENELLVRCAALAPLLAQRRPRPRWRTALVEHQNLRWHRTTLVGRMPGWCPPVAPVGPWRPVWMETRGDVALAGRELHATLEGDAGVVRARLRVALGDGVAIARAALRVGGATATLDVDPGGAPDERLLTGRLTIDRPARWWPHTHGEPARHAATLLVTLADGATREFPLGQVGFRTIAVDRGADGRGFTLRVNGVPVFCRGACWTPLDVATLDVTPAAYEAAIRQAVAGGMNMLRVGGTMHYEADAFHEACDAHGVMVWQDFMFANMDYPVADEAFAAGVRAEADQLLARLAHRPSLAVLCGGSEVEQQAAMVGIAPDDFPGALYDALLAGCAAAHRPDVPFVRNSPTGGALATHADAGVAHYYGVGAYLRPLEDARRARVRFASECLAFANVPSSAMTAPLAADGITHPRWKARVPRDRGAGWDFDDVRDHYLRLLLDVDPVALRWADTERYLELSRLVTGEVMARTLAEWRRPGSECGGALVWYLRDLWAGAGWGLVDAAGAPKAAWHFLRRACAPLALLATDEGTNGVALHVVNDTADAVDAELAVALWREGGVRVAGGAVPVVVPARGGATVAADAVLGRFTDVGHAHRFGPPGHQLVAATLRDRATGRLLGEAFHFPVGLAAALERDAGLAAEAWRVAGDEWALVVRAERFAAAVQLEIGGFDADDDWFHLAPGAERVLTLRAHTPGAEPRGRVRALEGRGVATVAPRVAPAGPAPSAAAHAVGIA